ncbi:hypothetical protein TruAng_000322 [Truncatella angustata]|nr:hypothetical protein TruAng_000322 [Truncatella angustata]
MIYRRESCSYLTEACSLVDDCVTICKRICPQIKDPNVVSQPLTALLYEQVETLTVQIYSLRKEILKCLDSGLSSTANLPDSLVLALSYTKTRLIETLDLAEFHQNEERDGQDGALNALYASIFILHRDQSHDIVPSCLNEDTLIKFGHELKNVVGKITMLPASRHDVLESFEKFRQDIVAYLSHVVEQSRPRHVQNYETLSDTPYIHDPVGTAFSGSFGTVQKVYHNRTLEPLAMKTFQNVFSEQETKKILREAEVLKLCCHPNIVRFVEALRLEEDDCLRIIMKPWAPCTLNRFLRISDAKRAKQCPWFVPGAVESDQCVYRIMYELADAVAYIHDRSIKHKDIKPENILFYRENDISITPMITDVGVSKVYIPGGTTNPKDSTYEYLSPEQHAETGSTPSSDIWQLGCCFAELLVVASGGSSAYRRLNWSYNNDNPDCACSIALEQTNFMGAFNELCVQGNDQQKTIHGLVCKMLDLEPSKRVDVNNFPVERLGLLPKEPMSDVILGPPRNPLRLVRIPPPLLYPPHRLSHALERGVPCPSYGQDQHRRADHLARLAVIVSRVVR